MGREEGHGCIAPVVHQPRGAILRVELEHRQELHGRDAQPLEVGNLLDEARERAARLFREAGARVTGEAAHMHLVHDRPRRGPLERGIALPVVRGDVDDNALQRRRCVVTQAAGSGAVVRAGNHDSSAIGVQEDFGGIEAHAARVIERPVDPITVQLAGSYVRHEHVPVIVRTVGGWIEAHHARGLGVVDPVEQQQLDAGGVPREDAEVDAVRRRRRAQR